MTKTEQLLNTKLYGWFYQKDETAVTVNMPEQFITYFNGLEDEQDKIKTLKELTVLYEDLLNKVGGSPIFSDSILVVTTDKEGGYLNIFPADFDKLQTECEEIHNLKLLQKKILKKARCKKSKQKIKGDLKMKNLSNKEQEMKNKYMVEGYAYEEAGNHEKAMECFIKASEIMG